MYRKLLDLRGAVVDTMIVRDADDAHIPADPRNADWQAYQAWLKAGNKPVASATIVATVRPTPAETGA